MKRFLPWLLPALVAAAGLIAIDVSPGPIVKYGAYFALAIALPGTLPGAGPAGRVATQRRQGPDLRPRRVITP